MTMTSTAELRLDDATHQAWLGDRELVRVTTALADAGIVDTTWYTQDSARRGNWVHQACLGNLVEGQYVIVPEWQRLYVDGFMAWRRASGFYLLASEQPVCDPLAGYAGRYDLLGCLPSVYSPYTVADLIDIKTGTAPRWVALQTMAYRRCLSPRHVRRWALELPGNGQYRLIPLNLGADHQIDPALDRQHEAVMLGAIAVSRWKRGL